MMRRLFTIVCACVTLAACQAAPLPVSTPTDDPLPISAWSRIEQIGAAEQGAAPVMLPVEDGLLLAWNSADESEARHIVRGVDGEARIVALKAWHPFLQTLLPAHSSEFLLLWLDRTQQAEELRLQAGIISEDAIARLGANVVSDLPTRSYSALMVESGALVVWSARLGAVNNLYADIVDRQARPSETIELRRDADYPMLVQDENGVIHLFWLEQTGRQAYHATITNPDQAALTDIRPLIGTALIGAADAVEGWHVALDGTHVHLFWNIRRLDNTHAVLHSAGDLASLQFDPPAPFGIVQDTARQIQTPYRSGEASAATRSSDAAVWWAVPLAGQHTILPIAVYDGSTLGTAYMQAGDLVAYQPVVAATGMIRAPGIASDAAQNLYLSWASVTQDSGAKLYVVDSR